MLTEPAIIERSAQPYLAIKEHPPMRDIARIAGEVLPELLSWLERNGVAPSGAPFFKYNVIDMTGQLEIEFGIPTATVVSGDSRVLTGVLPAGRYAVVTFRGSYDRLVDANAALLGWLRENRLRPEMKATSTGDRFGCRLEIYHTDPAKEPNPEKWETEIAVQLAKESR
jgi:effector-binding domain-containing protein